MFDYHIHSEFSMDSQEKLERIAQAAIQKNLREICITDHVEFDLQSPTKGNHDLVIDPMAYKEAIEKLQEQYAFDLVIKAGMEVGMQPHIIQRCNEYVEKGDFDFIIGSLHSVDKLIIHDGDFIAKWGRGQEAYAKYFEEYYQCVAGGALFNVLGHYDLMKRHLKGTDRDQVFRDNFDVIEATLKLVIEKGRGIEVNTSGFYYQIGSAMPSIDFLKLYKSLGGEILTLGSDGHKADNIGHCFEETLHAIQQAGFQYLTTFDKMQPKFHRI